MNLKDIISTISFAMKFGPGVDDLVQAGKPVEEAIMQAAPELGAAIKKIADAAFPNGLPTRAPSDKRGAAPSTTPELIIQKALFAPEQLDAHEAEQVDRASNPLGGGAG